MNIDKEHKISVDMQLGWLQVVISNAIQGTPLRAMQTEDGYLYVVDYDIFFEHIERIADAAKELKKSWEELNE